jgi:hypothetical protein
MLALHSFSKKVLSFLYDKKRMKKKRESACCAEKKQNTGFSKNNGKHLVKNTRGLF